MPALTWDRERAVAPADPVAVDELDGHVLVLDGVDSGDDAHLGWCRRAPCVVVGLVPAGQEPPDAVDVAVSVDEPGRLDDLVARVDERPHAARALAQVLRVLPGLGVADGLVVESLAYSTLLGGPEFAEWLAGRPRPSVPDVARPPVVLSRDGDRLGITLDRPENRNAFSAAMRDALFEALALAEVDGTIDAVVVDAAGPVFSSGGDLAEFGTAADPVRAHEIRIQRSVGALLARLAPKVTVHVKGACVGAGVELAAFAGRVVADPGTTFRLPEVAMGLIPGAGGTVSLTHRIGRQATARMVLLGEPVAAAEALRLGLVDEVGPEGAGTAG
jgi:enoyl-CoA hydratase/carnithine racemase